MEKTDKSIKTVENKALIAVENSLTNKAEPEFAPYIDFTNLESFGEYAQELLKSGFGKHTTKQSIMASCIWARDHNFPIMDCIAHLVHIQGKTGADAHLIKAMIQRARITDEVIEDYIPIYKYEHKERDFTQIDIENDPDKFIVCHTMSQVKKALELENSIAIPVLRTNIVDYRTKIKFTRLIKLKDGTWKTVIEYGTYLYSEAKIAGLVEKDVWLKYPSTMLYWRAYTKGARRIADDILLGVYEKTELLDAVGKNYKAEDVEYLEVQ